MKKKNERQTKKAKALNAIAGIQIGLMLFPLGVLATLPWAITISPHAQALCFGIAFVIPFLGAAMLFPFLWERCVHPISYVREDVGRLALRRFRSANCAALFVSVIAAISMLHYCQLLTGLSVLELIGLITGAVFAAGAIFYCFSYVGLHLYLTWKMRLIDRGEY